MRIKLMSFNIQHCRNFNFPREDRIDFDVMANTILSVNPDIVGLNEVRGEGEDSENFKAQAKILAEKTNLYYFFAPAIHIPNKGDYGNAILSRFPIIDTEIIPIPDPEVLTKHCETRCVLKAVIDIGKPLTVFVTHFGLNEAEAENASSTVVKLLSSTESPKVLMGDFNLNPDSPIIDPIRITMADTADVFDGVKYSYPSDNPERKIDYIFVSDDISIIDADILQIIASDHCPHTATIEI